MVRITAKVGNKAHTLMRTDFEVHKQEDKQKAPHVESLPCVASDDASHRLLISWIVKAKIMLARERQAYGERKKGSSASLVLPVACSFSHPRPHSTSQTRRGQVQPLTDFFPHAGHSSQRWTYESDFKAPSISPLYTSLVNEPGLYFSLRSRH